MLISVIIPTCHRNDLLAQCLDRLAPGRQKGMNVVESGCYGGAGRRSAVGSKQPVVGVAQTSDSKFQISNFPHYEVIVTDDGTIATSQEMIKNQYPWARWVAGPRKGPAANRNHGAAQAGGEWIVFTDDDCLPDANWLGAYFKAMRHHPVEVLEGKTSPAGVRARVDMECPVNETGGYLWSCNMAVKRSLFLAMSGFDTGFPGAAMEDVEFRTRLLKAGQKFPFIPDALVSHPWRLKKGAEFIRMKSQSWHYYISRHPEMHKKTSIIARQANLLRLFMRQILPAACQCHGRGLFRELYLLFRSGVS